MQLIMHPITTQHVQNLNQSLDSITKSTPPPAAAVPVAPEPNRLSSSAMIALSSSLTSKGKGVGGTFGSSSTSSSRSNDSETMTSPKSDSMRSSSMKEAKVWDESDGWGVFAKGGVYPQYVQMRVYQIQSQREVTGLEDFTAQGGWGLIGPVMLCKDRICNQLKDG